MDEFLSMCKIIPKSNNHWGISDSGVKGRRAIESWETL